MSHGVNSPHKIWNRDQQFENADLGQMSYWNNTTGIVFWNEVKLKY